MDTEIISKNITLFKSKVKPNCTMSTVLLGFFYIKIIIMIEVNENGFVSARHLHEVLKPKRDYSTWIKEMLSFGLEEGVDFNFHNYVEVRKEGNRDIKRTFKDLLFTIDTAKETAMVSKTKNSREVRKYLISLSNKKDTGLLLSHEEILKLTNVVKAAFIKEFRDVAREKHIDTYLPVEPKGYDYANANTQRNKVCGINRKALEQRLAKLNINPSTIEKGLLKVDKYELIRISIIDSMMHFGRSKEYAVNVGDFAKRLAENSEDSFSRINTMYSLPKSFRKTMEMLNK